MPCIERRLTSAGVLRLDVFDERVVRVRLDPAGHFTDTGLDRYGFILPPSGDGLALSLSGGDGTGQAATAAMAVSWGDGADLLEIRDAKGRPRVRLQSGTVGDAGAEVVLGVQPDEDWVGFGDQTRDRLYHRGHVADCHVRNVTSYIPVPFFMSTAGYGVVSIPRAASSSTWPVATPRP